MGHVYILGSHRGFHPLLYSLGPKTLAALCPLSIDIQARFLYFFMQEQVLIVSQEVTILPAKAQTDS